MTPESALSLLPSPIAVPIAVGELVDEFESEDPGENSSTHSSSRLNSSPTALVTVIGKQEKPSGVVVSVTVVVVVV